MNLILDIGNTRTKMALFDATNNLHQKQVQTTQCDQESIEQFIVGQQIEGVILTNSGEVSNDVLDWLEKKFKTFIHLSNATPIPIANNYGTPQTLGKDRLAAAVGATVLFPKKNCLFIDCGTCLTYNIVSAEGAFLGGNITPGVTMRLRAMHEFTARLPLVAISEVGFRISDNTISEVGSRISDKASGISDNTISEVGSRKSDKVSGISDVGFRISDKNYLCPLGTTTETALRNGAQWGALMEMEGFLEGFMQRFSHLKTLLTGGDANFFVKYIKKEIFAEPNLVLIGLNTILNYNNQQKNDAAFKILRFILLFTYF
jgi:type III pantothenate kinase